MTTINFDNTIKATEEYKVGDWLMRVMNGRVDDNHVYHVTSIAIDDSTKKYVLIPVGEHPVLAAEPMFDTLAEMVTHYFAQHVELVKVDVDMNVKLSN